GRIEFAVDERRTHAGILERYLLNHKLVDREDLRGARASKRPLVLVLLEQGLLDRDAAQEAISYECAELVYSALRWRGGAYSFERGAVFEDAQGLNAELSIPDVVMEGLRRMDEWGLIAPVIRGTHQRFVHNLALSAELDSHALSLEERTILQELREPRT